MKNNVWTDLEGDAISLAGLEVSERALIDRCRDQAKLDPEGYHNFWMKEVSDLYVPRGLSRRQITQTAVYRIAQDIGSRLMVEAGEARLPDYRDDLERLIRERFPSRRAFCEAAGISEDMLSHVLARRKHLAIWTLTEALSRIGCRLRIVEESEASSAM